MLSIEKMNSRMRNHVPLLEYLSKLSPRQQISLIKGAPVELIYVFSEICLNLLKENIPLSPHMINKLRPFERSIVKLSQKSHSVKKRKKILVQKGGMLATLLSIVPAIISSIIAATGK